MAQKTTELRNSFSRGVLDPDLWERIDTEHYWLALKRGLNLVSIPQGGVKRRPGLRTQARLRRRLVPIPVAASQVTAHNGGNPAYLVDQSPGSLFTTNATASSPFVVAEVDFSSPVTVSCVDVLNFSVATAGLDRCLTVEYWNGSAWVALQGNAAYPAAKSVRTTARSRRFAGAPGTSFTSQNWRLTLYAPITTVYTGVSGRQYIRGQGWVSVGQTATTVISTGAVSVGGLRFWQESAVIGNARLVTFAKTTENVYDLVLTDRNIDVFKFGVYCASVPLINVGDEIVRQCTFEQSLDTLLLFHKQVPTPWIVRQGADDEWNFGYGAYTNLPALSSNTAFSGSQNEVQELNFNGLTPGDTFFLGDNDRLTGAITYSTPTNLVNDIYNNLIALPGRTAEINVVLNSSSPLSIGIGYYGGNGNQTCTPLSFIPANGCQGSCATTVVQRGLNASGAIMEDTTGFPSCGIVHQSRLMLGGFRSAPSTWLMSRAGNYLDFTLAASTMTPDLAIQGTIDSDDVEEIRHLYIGQRLHLFTTRGEWWSDNTTFDATKTTDIILATRYGAASEVFPAFVQNGTLFVQEGGQDGALANTVVRDFVYNWQINNYESEPLSLLGGQLFTDITSIAHRAGVTTKDASLIFFVNADGSFPIMTLLKSQDITAITENVTQGRMIDVGVDLLRNARAIVQRTASSGQADNYLELFDENTYLDAAVSFAGPATSVTLPDPLAGQPVFAYLDGDVYGPLTPNGATLTLPVSATNITVGSPFTVDIEMLPWRPNPKAAAPTRKMVRVPRVELSVVDTGPFQISANDGPFIDAPIRHFDGGPLPQEATTEEPTNDCFDVPMMQRLYSGYCLVDGLQGWTRFGRVRIQQTIPAPFKLRSIRYEVAYG